MISLKRDPSDSHQKNVLPHMVPATVPEKNVLGASLVPHPVPTQDPVWVPRHAPRPLPQGFPRPPRRSSPWPRPRTRPSSLPNTQKTFRKHKITEHPHARTNRPHAYTSSDILSRTHACTSQDILPLTRVLGHTPTHTRPRTHPHSRTSQNIRSHAKTVPNKAPHQVRPNRPQRPRAYPSSLPTHRAKISARNNARVLNDGLESVPSRGGKRSKILYSRTDRRAVACTCGGSEGDGAECRTGPGDGGGQELEAGLWHWSQARPDGGTLDTKRAVRDWPGQALLDGAAPLGQRDAKRETTTAAAARIARRSVVLKYKTFVGNRLGDDTPKR